MLALDLFAGTGWGVACQRLGIQETGVEIMPEAVATREANGMTTAYRDVWDGLRSGEPMAYDLLIASPPCQTFSVAGGGAGRRALDDVLAVIHDGTWRDAERLHELETRFDPRTALVVTPLAHVYRDLPRAVVLEQVPPVLPVWEAMAEVMRGMGYSVWTGILNAEQYGVPQTRRRAVLIARIDAEAKPPVPTHSRYYSRDPQRLDPGVLPWVSMAEALGWGRAARPSVTVTGGGTETGGAEPLGHLAREVAAPDWIMRSNYGTSGDPAARGERTLEQPAATVTSKANRNKWTRPDGEPINLDPERPATTVAGDPRLSSRQHHNHGEQNSTSTRVTVAEAALLQSYPAGFTFCGGKGKQFLQVGNAVPPLLAQAILASVI